jgi:hypothetical protein
MIQICAIISLGIDKNKWLCFITLILWSIGILLMTTDREDFSGNAMPFRAIGFGEDTKNLKLLISKNRIVI